MLLSWDTCILCLGLSGLCCPVLVRRQIAPAKGTCRRVAQLSREDAAVRAAPHVGLVAFLYRRYRLTGCSEKPLSPTPGTSSKKVVVCKNTTQLGKCSRHASKGCLFQGAGARQQAELTALYQQGSACWGTGEALLWDPHMPGGG